ncbi:hypothetical protein B9Y78_06460 [Stenotrophomonas maltophilia]|jgi:hypothetical protein|nr:hypothetical protein B9Y78_06460 [Stenotrophomonas maltophilia]
MHNELSCRICGYISDAPHWGEDGKTPDFELCACCGVEHGYQDCNRVSCLKYREKWIAEGARWEEPKMRPDQWNWEEQLKNVSDEYL